MEPSSSLFAAVHSLDPKKTFKEIFSRPISEQKIDALIATFGRLNQPLLSKLISPRNNGKYKGRIKSLCKMEQKINRVVFEKFNPANPLDTSKLEKLYDSLLLSSTSPLELTYQTINLYLLSDSMPLQEAIFLKWNTIPIIKKWIDASQLDYERTLASLFEKTAVSHHPFPVEIPLDEELQLLKYAPLKGHGKVISWERLLSLWDIDRTRLTLHLDKILFEIPDRDSSLPAPAPFVSFQNYVINQTLAYFKSVLPKELDIEFLRDIFSNSERTRQDAVYFIDHLHTQYCKSHPPAHFPFSEGLSFLERLIPDPPHSRIYPFLHSCLHYFHCMRHLTVDPNHSHFLFNAIFSLTNEERKKFDRPFQDKNKREPFQLDHSVVRFSEGHPSINRQNWGKIFLRIGHTHSAEENGAEKPFLSFSGHILLLEKIERDFGIKIPPEIAADFLLFQFAETDIFNKVDEFLRVRDAIQRDYLKSLSIPTDLYDNWQELPSHLLASIKTSMSQLPKFLDPYHYPYVVNMGRLGAFLQLIVYPKPSTSFCHAMPIGRDDNALSFNEGEESPLNRVELFLPEFLTGPAKLFQWIYNDHTKCHSFTVSLFNSIQTLRTACIFQVPLEISDIAETMLPSFFFLLQKFVDDLGKERFSEEDESQLSLLEITNTSDYSISMELIETDSSLSEEFEAYVECAPLLDSIWNEQSKQFGPCAPLIKATLWEFIKKLRTNFKKGFYTVMQPDRAPQLMKDSDTHFQIYHFENGDTIPKDLLKWTKDQLLV